MTNELTTILDDTVNRLFADHVTKELISAAETGQWPAALWALIEEAGLCQVLVPEEQGGAGASWADAFVLFKAVGAHVAPVPLAEGIVAHWAAARAGLSLDEGVSVPMLGDFTLDGDKLSGSASHVPYARYAANGVAIVDGDNGPHLVVAPIEHGLIEDDQNIAREPRDKVRFEGISVTTQPSALNADSLYVACALMKSCQMAGALANVLDQTLRYANERTQFGKPIGKFQAIQHQLAILATQYAAANTAAAFACQKADKVWNQGANAGDPRFAVAVAKTRADEAAGIATSIGHQTHGAIGFTYEHGLHFATRRLWSWRAEYGAGIDWARELGEIACERGADTLWPDMTAA